MGGQRELNGQERGEAESRRRFRRNVRRCPGRGAKRREIPVLNFPVTIQAVTNKKYLFDNFISENRI